MKRRKLPNHRAQAQAHHQRTDAYVGALIEDLRRQSLDSALLLAELVHYDGTEELLFDAIPQVREAVKRIRLTYAQRLRLGIASAVSREWNIASKAQDNFVAKALNAYGLRDEDGKYYPKNEDALQAFTKRREQGLRLSERVWDLSGEHMQSLERAISTAVHEGWSAQTLSKRVSQYLKDFPKLKQDYSERFGKAIDIQDCEYKSARLARTEINMAYREAERTRWQELDFVTAYEVKRSGREYDCPVCSELAGKYPKDFKWAGWHPNCRCYAVPVLSTEDEFWASFESDTPTPSSNEVTDVPENFKQWLSENTERHQRAKARGTEPYFLRDNPKYTAGKSPTPKPEPSPTPSAPATPPKPSIAERAQARHNARTPQQIADIQKRWDERRIVHYMTELPDNLDKNTKRAIAVNNIELERAFGIRKGKPMSYDEANNGAENPLFLQGNGYRVNCQTCTATHLLRRRGFSVESMPNVKDSAFKLMEERGITWMERFLNPDGSSPDYDPIWRWAYRNKIEKIGVSQMKRYLLEKMEDSGIYEIYCGWKGGKSAHVFCAEVKGGKIKFFDPQSGSSNATGYIQRIRPRTMMVLRIDDKIVNPKIHELFLTKRG